MRPQTRLYILLGALCALLFLWRLGACPLIGLDEGLYAECAREMFVSGNYVVPSCNGVQFFDKPPLGYWLQSACMSVFGVSSFSVRLPSAVAGLLLVALTVFLGSKFYSKRAGILSGFIFGTAILTAGMARLCSLDMLFTLTITASLGAFLLARLELVPRWVYLIFWAALGLSVLVKGPAGAVLILFPILAYFLIKREPVKFGRTMPAVGLLVFLVIAVPWYALVQQRTGGAFLREFIIHQNLQRAAGEDFHHNMPFFFYPPVYLAVFFPWSAFVPAAWAGLVRRRPQNKLEAASLFAAVWVVTVVAIFSLSKSKLLTYIFPVFPPSALLVGQFWAHAIESGKPALLRRSTLASMVVGAIVGAALLVGERFLPRPIPGLTLALVPMGATLVVGTVAAYALIVKRKMMPAFAALNTAMVVFLLVAVTLGLPIAARQQAQPVARMGKYIRKTLPANRPVFSFKLKQPQLAFYAGRPVPEKDPGTLRNAMREHPRCFVVSEEGNKGLPDGGKVIRREGEGSYKLRITSY